jgi:NAD(P)-dependent dehydrogenase (short-subunit alcohol dehydrogenase family)
MDQRLNGKVAIVIGAAGHNNMGQVIAKRLTDEGAKVCVAGRHPDELERFAKEIGGIAITCDITDRDQVFNLTRETKKRLGRVDIGVNATGWGLLEPFEKTTQETLDKMVELQFKGPYWFFQALIEAMKSNAPAYSSIITISSATAKIMLNDHASYMGCKAGIDHVIRIVANEFGKYGIRANSVSPGLTETPMTAEAKKIPGVYDSFLPGYPLGRIGTKEDIAAAVAFLCTDECFMTGENLQVNGGLTLRRNPTREEIGAAIANAAGPG